jgi:hypothetical protein
MERDRAICVSPLENMIPDPSCRPDKRKSRLNYRERRQKESARRTRKQTRHTSSRPKQRHRKVGAETGGARPILRQCRRRGSTGPLCFIKQIGREWGFPIGGKNERFGDGAVRRFTATCASAGPVVVGPVSPLQRHHPVAYPRSTPY